MPSIRKVETTNVVLAPTLGIGVCLQRGIGNTNDSSVEAVIGGVLLISSACYFTKAINRKAAFGS